MDFKKYLREKVSSETAVMAFGRFNPPTVGHEKLINRVKEVAKEHDGIPHIIASHSEGTAKDPLPQTAKLDYLKKVAPDVNVSGSSKDQPSIFHAASKLHGQGHQHLVIVAGSDRVDEYKNNLEKYNGVEGKHGYYNFKSITVVPAGDKRDPDAKGVEGMSGTKMRKLARSGDTEGFAQGLPDSLKAHAEEITKHIKAVKEDYENPYRFDWGTPEGTEYMKKMTPGMKTQCGAGEVWSKEKGICVPIREAYLDNKIFKLSEEVESVGGDKGKIVYRGATYVTLQLENGETKKYWVKDIKQPVSVIRETKTTSIKNKMSGAKIPVLLMTKQQIESNMNNTKKIRYKDLTEMHNERDINFTPEKDVRMGIDKVCSDQVVNGKPVGLVSFRTFMQDEVARIAQQYDADRKSINISQEMPKSTSYDSMNSSGTQE